MTLLQRDDLLIHLCYYRSANLCLHWLKFVFWDRSVYQFKISNNPFKDVIVVLGRSGRRMNCFYDGEDVTSLCRWHQMGNLCQNFTSHWRSRIGCCIRFHVNHKGQYITIDILLNFFRLDLFIDSKNILSDVYSSIIIRTILWCTWRKTIFNCTILFMIRDPMILVTTLASFSLQRISLEIIGSHLLTLFTNRTI